MYHHITRVGNHIFSSLSGKLVAFLTIFANVYVLLLTISNILVAKLKILYVLWSDQQRFKVVSTFQNHFGYLHSILYILFKESMLSMPSTESLMKNKGRWRAQFKNVICIIHLQFNICCVKIYLRRYQSNNTYSIMSQSYLKRYFI